VGCSGKGNHNQMTRCTTFHGGKGLRSSKKRKRSRVKEARGRLPRMSQWGARAVSKIFGKKHKEKKPAQKPLKSTARQSPSPFGEIPRLSDRNQRLQKRAPETERSRKSNRASEKKRFESSERPRKKVAKQLEKAEVRVFGSKNRESNPDQKRP